LFLELQFLNLNKSDLIIDSPSESLSFYIRLEGLICRSYGVNHSYGVIHGVL